DHRDLHSFPTRRSSDLAVRVPRAPSRRTRCRGPIGRRAESRGSDMSNDTPTPRRALITGASGELGGAIARRLARDGFHVIAHANSRPEAVELLALQLKAAGGSAEAVCFDVTNRGACETALAALTDAGAIQ